MYWSDHKSLDFLAGIALVAFPLAGVAWGLWGWIWEILILLAVFWLGSRRGWGITALFLAVGYGSVALAFRWSGLEQMGYIPFAGLLTVVGWKRHWPQSVNTFWSLTVTGFLAALPLIGFVRQGLDPAMLKEIVSGSLASYKSSGMLAAAQQLGVTESQLKAGLEKMLPVYFSLIPSFAALSGLVKFGLASYIAARFVPESGRTKVPFSRWRLPWYAVWGAILGIASYLLGDQFGWFPWKTVGMNLMVVYAVVALVLGVAVYGYVLKSAKVPRFVKWLLLMVNLFFFFFSLVALMMFGLFDVVFNFRKLPETES
ncbi:hypothetical protein CEB3_c41450 [Peptococcaceae bacterium CEB3]|nr:hypothetical protein CEB3_c41450 [Peptococcaceae bacterium CEB3]